MTQLRRLFTVILTFSLIAGFQASAYAQTAAYAELSNVNAESFPRISALLDVYDANGEFIPDLQPSNFTVYEDGGERAVDAISQLAPPVQIAVAINPGPALAKRDANGLTRFDKIVGSLSAWANLLPPESQDDFSLLSLSPLINHVPAKDWLVSLKGFKPDLNNTIPNLQTLDIALDVVNAQTSQPGMKRAVLFITPLMDDPNIDNAIAPYIQKAVDSRIRVFVWMVDGQEKTATPGENALKLLALQTNGSFFVFSGREAFPDLNSYFAPLRHIYSITYTSALKTSGDHTLGGYIQTPQARIPALDVPFNTNIQPPNAFFISPPSQITRQPPADDPYNPDVLLPAQQPLEIIVEFPDGHPRELKRTTLYVNGQIVAENIAAPFDTFNWDLNAYTQSGSYEIVVEAEDTLGLQKASIASIVTLTVIPAPSGVQALLGRYRTYVILGAIGLTGVALMTILLFGRRGRGSSTIERVEIRKRLEDPLTQPVPALTGSSASRNLKSQPRKPLAPNWMQTKPPVQDAPAYLIRLANGGEPVSVAPIPVTDKETIFGTNPVQSTRVLDDPSISPIHARIKQMPDGSFMIYDHGSVAGTWVNFEPVAREGYRLQHGDRIHFGRMIYRFDLKQAPVESEPQVVRH